MKRSKTILGLLGVLGAACAVTYGVTKYEEEKELIKNSDEIILEISSDQVTALAWEYEEEYLAFHKDETWEYDEDEAFPVSEDKIAELLDVFESFGVAFKIEDVEDYSQYGLDAPMCSITLTTEEETYKLELGDFSTMDSQRYVSLGDGNVYLVKEDPFDTYELTISDMIEHDEIPSFDQVNELLFSGEEELRVFCEKNSDKTYSEYDVYFLEHGEESLPLDTPTVNAYVRTIRNLELNDYVTYNVTEEELRTFGMDDPELTVMLNHSWTDKETEEKKEDSFVLYVSEVEEDDEEITAYVRVGESKIVYKIGESDYEELMAVSYNDLRHKEVLTAQFKNINQIDISLDDIEYTITTEGNSEGRKYFFRDEELEINTFQSALMDLEAEEFTEETPIEKEEISLTVHLDNTNYPEVRIELYRYNGEQCLAVVDGEPVSLVDRAQVVELIEAVYAIVLE